MAQQAAVLKDVELLIPGEWSDIQSVLRDSHAIWSSGLDKSTYYEYIWWQMNHRWSRRHYQYFVAKTGDDVVASIKLYTLRAFSRHQEFKIGGIGAVYTPRIHRGHDYARQLLEAIHDYCEDEDYDAMLLHSDIGLDFYAELGYEPLGACEFYIWLPAADSEYKTPLPDLGEDESARYSLGSVELSMVPYMVRHYRRWRERQPFAMDRDEDYWHYKLARERYVSERSRKQFVPTEILMTKDPDEADGGYALFERSAKVLRVLEVVGSDERQESLWRHLLRLANLWGIGVIRGWEAAAPIFIKGVRFVPRDYSLPMILPFNPVVAKWQEPLPCPLFELDHF